MFYSFFSPEALHMEGINFKAGSFDWKSGVLVLFLRVKIMGYGEGNYGINTTPQGPGTGVALVEYLILLEGMFV